MKFVKKEILIKSIILLAISFLYLGRALNGIDPYATGDGPEYILTTEAFYNHLSPDIRASDCKSFKLAYIRQKPWTTNYKYDIFDQIEEYISIDTLCFMQESGGIYVSKDLKKYGYHFWLYSLINLPGRCLAAFLDASPLMTFQVTNAFLIIITCFFLLFYSPFSLWKSVLFTLIFTFSSVYWYLGWTHSEVFTVCLVTLSFWLFFQKKTYLSLLIIAFASSQNQPLIIMLAFIGIYALIQYKFKLGTLIKIGLFSFPAFIPSIFYFYHFNTINLIKDAGFLDNNYITFTRVFGFFFDVNQGAVLAIPLILVVYLFLIIRHLYLVVSKKEKPEYHYLLPIFILIMVCIFSSMKNWNHGQAIINRYASWTSTIILVHTIFITSRFNYLPSLTLFNYFFVTQTFTTLYHEQFNINDWSMFSHTPLAKWFIEIHPEYYNPDPHIFISRTRKYGNLDASVSPIFYFRNFNTITKLVVHRDKLDSLKYYGVTNEQLIKLKANLNFINDWAYLNKGDFKFNLSGQEIYQIVREVKRKIIIEKIRDNSVWMKQIEEKAKLGNVSIEQAIWNDSEYSLQLEEKSQ